MMDIRPLIASPDPLSSSRDLRSLHSVFAPREAAIMIIDGTSHNSAMPVSPKQGETIAADSLSKQEPQLVSSSLTSSSWEHLSKPKTSLSSSSSTSSHHGSMVLGQTWASVSPRSSSPIVQVKTRDVPEVADKYQTSQMNSESRFDSWSSGNGHLNSTTISSPAISSPHNPQSPPRKRKLEDSEEHEELPSTIMSASKMSARNYDRPDSSPSPQSQHNSSFDEAEHTGSEVSMQTSESFVTSSMNMYGSFERRSRRKPTIGDIVRRVRPPVDVPPYDTEESETEDDILQDEILAAKMNGEHQSDEVDGMIKANMRMVVEREYREGEARQFTPQRLSRLEAVDGMPEDDDNDEEMEMRSESDSTEEPDKHAFLKDVPDSIYNLMQDVKVNAHTLFMKTASTLPPMEAKLRREQYLLQLLSDLRYRCEEEGLKPDVIGAILKDVETEVTYLSEDFEDMKPKQYFPSSDKESCYNGIDGNESHFLSRPDAKLDEDKERKKSYSHDSPYSAEHPPSFFTNISASSQQQVSSTSSPLPTSDSKPIIVTVSADIKLPPPLLSSRGGHPPHLSLPSNISDHAFGPMFPSNKFRSWLPPDLVSSMAMYNFNSIGALDPYLVRNRISLEGKLGETIDKDYLKCQFCERTFRRQKNLENHVENTHQGKGPLKPRRDTNDMYFKCSHCPYTTKHQSNLYVHLRIHTGERPYICGACGVQYSQSHSLKSHIINKHEGIMSYYIKEKRTRSPRGMGYLSAQVMHDNNIFKLPGPMMSSPMHHTNLDIVNKAIEFATSETAKHQQHFKQQQHFSPSGVDGSSPRGMMPPPLTSIMSGDNIISSSNSGTQSSIVKSPATQSNGQNGDHGTPTPNNTLFNPTGAGSHPPFFMNSHPLMFGELPHHIRSHSHIGNGHHPPAPHPFLSGFPHFPPNSSIGYHGTANLSPLSGLSPNSSPASSTPNSHHTLPPHLQLPGSLSHLTPSPIPLLQQQQIKKEPQAIPTTPVSSKPRGQPDEAIDLRKKSPPLDTKEQHAHDLNSCGGKENCAHAAKLKYLRLNVVRMLGILVPNLNFAEKGISAESESVDELLQDVIESNTHDDDME